MGTLAHGGPQYMHEHHGNTGTWWTFSTCMNTMGILAHAVEASIISYEVVPENYIVASGQYLTYEGLCCCTGTSIVLGLH